jgi:hypothetical protein
VASYVDCFQTPVFTTNGSSGACTILHKPTDSYYKWPTDQFRTVSTIKIDASRCASFFTGATSEARARVADLLQPFEVDLRPGSTDHDVFLQVRNGP